MISQHPFSSSVRPSNHNFFLYEFLPNLDVLILGWSSLKVVQRSDKKKEALIAIYGIATPVYRTIMSLQNIKFIQKSTCVKF